MATPFSHASVSHVTKMGRRRSQSVTIPNEIEENAPEKTHQRKQFFAQLQKERQKQKNNGHVQYKEPIEDHEEQDKEGFQAVVTRVAGGNTSRSTKKHTNSTAANSVSMKDQRSVTNFKSPASEDDDNDDDDDDDDDDEEEEHQPVVTRVAGAKSTNSKMKHRSSSAIVLGPSKQQRTLTGYKNPITNDDEGRQTGITRVQGGNNTQLTKKSKSFFTANSVALKEQGSLTNSKNANPDDDEQHHRTAISRVKPSANITSVKKHTTTAGAVSSTLHKETTSVASNSDGSEINGHHSRVTRIPRSESTRSFKKQTSNKNSNINIFTTLKNSNFGSGTTLKGIDFEPSQLSHNPLISSSSNLMSKSEIFDQEFHLDDSKDRMIKNDGKRHGKININGREQQYTKHERRVSARSSAAFMAAIIGIIIAIIAFAFGLTSLILVLLLRSTVATKLGANSTDSTSISIENWPSGCSSYTTLDDPTRNVNAVGYALGCDNTSPFNRTTAIWIRFIGSGGTKLPLTTPGMNICGSEGTGWYDGVMPSIAGQLLNGTACFSWYTSVCRYSQMISVANCGSFYVYLLPPAPACMMRYCTI